MAGGKAINQGAKTDLVGDAGPCEPLGDNADNDAKHGGATIKKLSSFQLFHMDFGFAAAEILAVGWGVGHGVKNGWKAKEVEMAVRLAQRSAGLRGQVAGAGEYKGHHSSQYQNEGNDAGDCCGVVSTHGSKPVKVFEVLLRL